MIFYHLHVLMVSGWILLFVKDVISLSPIVLNAILLQVYAHYVEMDSGGMVLLVQPALQDALNVRMTELQISIVLNAHLIKY